MPGSYSIFMGICWAVIGLLITGITFLIVPGGYVVVAYGAVIVGGLQAAVGIIQMLVYKLKSPEARARHHAKVDVRTIVQCMAVVAGADGEIDANEIATIRDICVKLTNSDIDEKTINKIARSIARNEDSVDDWLARIVGQMTAQGAEIALKAGVLVALADGSVSEVERDTLNVMQTRFGFSENTVDKMIAEFGKGTQNG